MLVVNKRNLRKEALILRGKARPARWTSRYGSVTFNQHGREFPLGGINEKGLAIEVMWLPETDYGYPGERPALNELQWVQFQLDHFATVSELAAAVERVAVSKVYAPLHYLACDASGACAAIEFLGGRAVLRRGGELPVAALTNSAYSDSLGFINRLAGLGGNLPIPNGPESLPRFARASYLLSRAPAKGHLTHAFRMLEGVRVVEPPPDGDPSQWQIVYELGQRRISFRMAGSGRIQSLSTASLDYKCSTPAKALKLDPGISGDISRRLIPYTTGLNKEIVRKGLRPFAAWLPSSTLDRVAMYPDSLACVEDAASTGGRPSGT